MKSTFLSLNSSDFVKGLVLSVLTTIVTIVYSSLQSGSLSFDWKSILTAALSSALAYVIKNYLTNSQDQLLKKEPKV